MTDDDCEFTSLDGLRLRGTIRTPAGPVSGSVVIVHGINVDRNEYGDFNVRLAERLAAEGLRSLRFDLRGHGESEGRQEELTLCGGMSDVAAACDRMLAEGPVAGVHIVASSFGGGIAALHAARASVDLRSLVLLNPNLDYHASWLARDAYWEGGRIGADAAAHMRDHGWVAHGDFRVGRPLLNELIHLSPALEMARIRCPTLTIHGDADTVVPYEVAQRHHGVAADSTFLPIPDADHGFAVPGDESGTAPESLKMQRIAFDAACEWIARHRGQDV